MIPVQILLKSTFLLNLCLKRAKNKHKEAEVGQIKKKLFSGFGIRLERQKADLDLDAAGQQTGSRFEHQKPVDNFKDRASEQI